MFMVCVMEVPCVPSLNMNNAFRTEGYHIEEYLLSIELDERFGIAKDGANERGANRPYFGCGIENSYVQLSHAIHAQAQQCIEAEGGSFENVRKHRSPTSRILDKDFPIDDIQLAKSSLATTSNRIYTSLTSCEIFKIARIITLQEEVLESVENLKINSLVDLARSVAGMQNVRLAIVDRADSTGSCSFYHRNKSSSPASTAQ
ncbi:hypothetical protein ANN_17563 [Periplaneta americana]|uniref:Uncharacterized protein n=1 Tax=Periplaneta americana TaxID=6978 RepID=A0ABQ8SUB0_PERAM|nr:hypothetical protein ANN_17563 [Periplaneta americana]